MAQSLTNKVDSISYIIGINLADNIKRQGLSEINTTVLAKGVSDYLASAQLQIDKKEGEIYITKYMNEIKSMQGKEVKTEGERFLEANAKKPGVVKLPSGLQYEILVQGAGGPKPKATDQVKTHYHGTLINGTVFDSSVERGEPISFGLSQVIKGWTEGLQLMSVGDKYRFYIPYDLAYGDRGAGGAIPAYAALIFEVELLGINE
ncbi:MAG: FKBP-type peptidyl-prolyl cis-trans isomerase [Saprospiraceae bacterium]|nr:FKBP-type peptidyl-prolyl cis-trans isomerase [Saprospiraceae bacterium]